MRFHLPGIFRSTPAQTISRPIALVTSCRCRAHPSSDYYLAARRHSSYQPSPCGYRSVLALRVGYYFPAGRPIISLGTHTSSPTFLSLLSYASALVFFPEAPQSYFSKSVTSVGPYTFLALVLKASTTIVRVSTDTSDSCPAPVPSVTIPELAFLTGFPRIHLPFFTNLALQWW